MRPRRHIFHHSEPPPPPPASAYQSMNQDSRVNQFPSSSSEQSMAPPPPLPMGHHSAGPSATPPRTDFITELIRLGLHPEDMMSAKQSSNPRQQHPPGQEEVLKNLQALLGKGDVADLVQKLQPNDWSSMAPQAASDYSRVAGGSSCSGGNPGNRDSVIRGPAPMFATAGGGGGGSGSGSGSNVGASGTVSFTNNINNNGNSSHQEQDIQFANVQHQAHQQFRVPATTNSSNTSMQNSPYYRQLPQASQSEQMKSILRYRHQQQQKQQNDSSYRQRLSHLQQQQHISNVAAASNLPFANLSDLGGSVPPTSAAASSGSGGTSTILDTSNNPSSIFSHHTNKTSPALSSYTIASGGGSSMAPRVPTNLMDALSGGSAAGSSGSVSSNTNGPTPGIDISMHDNSPFQLSGSIMNNNNNSLQRDNMKQKSIARNHQQLRGQLRANNDKLKNYPWPNQQGVSSSSSSHGGGGGSDMQSSNQQPRSNQSNNNTESMSQMKRQLTSPLASAISPPNQTSPAAPSSMPKSLLNLAAFSTSPPTTNNINAMTSNPKMTGQMQQANRNASMAANQAYGIGVEAAISNNRQQQQQQQQSAARTCNTTIGSSLIQKVSPSSSGDPTTSNQLLQQMIARSSSNSTKTNPNVAPRTNYSNYSLSSLLSDDQSSTRGNVSTSNIGRAAALSQSNSRVQNPAVIPNSRRPPSAKSDDAITAMPETRKDAYLALLQERAAKAGISIGEIGPSGSPQNQSLDLAANSQYDNQINALQYNQQQQHQQNNNINLNNNRMFARKEIESALDRVENRNDLSLLYPPISLSSNSQKQVNSLSAGLQLTEDVDVFTDEVKKIVQEGCNIIYECKTCCNLFRSLANLVKHKRTFCKSEENEAAARFELTRRANMNALQSVDLSVTKSHQGSSGAGPARPSATVQSVEGPPNVLRVEMPTHHHVNTRATRSDAHQPPAVSQPPPAPSLGSQKYNLRGKRVDVSALTTRMPTRNHPDNRHASTSRDQGESRQTNLSRLLQGQPRNHRPPQVVKDSALMDALSMGPSTASTNSPSTRQDSTFYQDHVRNSSLAKTLLSESARSMSGGVDRTTHMMERETNNNMQQTSSKRPTGPKRKALEDCIRKVKRDKLGPDEDPNFSQASNMMARDHQQQQLRQSNQHQFRDPLDMDDSGADSDALVMDLDDDHHQYPPMHETRRGKSHARTSSSSMSALAASFSQSNSKLNSSSALLKALTRPVESRPSYGSTNHQKACEKFSPGQQAKDTSAGFNNKPQLGQDATSGHQPDETSTIESQNDAQVKPAAPSSPLMSHCSCDLCERSFSDPSNLIDHIFEEHPNKEKYIYPCIFCSLSFIALENVCRHMVDIHKKSKAQVNKLKDVVQSRSHVSEDLDNCDDVPAEHKIGSKNHQSKSRLSPGALSDSAATQQILDDTLALVSMAASPTKLTSAHSPIKKETAAPLPTRSSARHSGAEPSALEEGESAVQGVVQEEEEVEERSSQPNIDDSEQGSQSGLEIDDRLSDSMIPSISDEQLAILEREEAEIEAERLRREEHEALQPQPDDPSEADDDLIDDTEDRQHHISLQPPPSSQEVEGSSVQESASSYESQNWRDEYQRPTKKNDSSGKAIVANEPPSRHRDDDDDDDEEEEEDDDDNDVERDEELEDTQSTHGSSQHGRVSRGKHMVVLPVRQASDDDDEEEEEDDDDDDDDDAEDLDAGRGGPDDEDNDDEEDVVDGDDDDEGDDQSEVDSEVAVDDNDDDEDSWPVPDDDRGGYANYQGTTNDLPSSQLGNDDSDDDDNMLESHRSRRVHRRRSSHGSSTKGDHHQQQELSSSSHHNHHQHETNDKTANYDHDDMLPAPRASSAAPKSKHKHGASREASTGVGGASSASSSSGGGGGGTVGATTPGSSSGGGIMKLKIQLKKQPDEKNQVYRIVD